jgi:hypothetical protein
MAVPVRSSVRERRPIQPHLHDAGVGGQCQQAGVGNFCNLAVRAERPSGGAVAERFHVGFGDELDDDARGAGDAARAVANLRVHLVFRVRHGKRWNACDDDRDGEDANRPSRERRRSEWQIVQVGLS